VADRGLPSPGRLLFLPALSAALLLGAFTDLPVEPASAAMMGGPRLSVRSAKSYRTPAKRNSRKPQVTLLKRQSKHASHVVASKKDKRGSKKQAKVAHARPAAARAIPPQLYLEKLNQLTIRPGVVHKFAKGGLNVNVVEVDMKTADVKIRPYMASETFDKLKNVEQHAKESGALVAVNANYFKNDGTPLGTIKVDNEWVSGSLFNRVAMGITRGGDLTFARVNLHGILETSNPQVPRLWVNNMNQPRRSGVRLIMYTRRWGNTASLPYEGRLISVSNKGEVLDTHTRSLTIPYGGYVLTDKKDSAIAHLKRGDFVDLDWQTDPKDWNSVTHAISGGPTLIKEGNLFVGLKDERFRPNWTSAKITRRTACGVTADRKLVLATVEGPHTLWDLAKFMKQLGCVEAMNLDGGGSTTMVVNGNTVTRNDCTGQRKVAATLTVMEPTVALRHERRPDLYYQPSTNLQEFSVGTDVLSQVPMTNGTIQARIQQRQLAELTLAGAKKGNFLGIDQQFAPEKAIGNDGILSTFEGKDAIIELDNDLVHDSIQGVHKDRKIVKVDKSDAEKKAAVPAKTFAKPAVPALDRKAENAPAPIKAAAPQPEKTQTSEESWTTKIFKPFKFGKRS
jgi:uncharacterized protein YigE (DUF2233 family)